jgi:hypothetical protein
LPHDVDIQQAFHAVGLGCGLHLGGLIIKKEKKRKAEIISRQNQKRTQQEE